jgi:high-affinity nickel permease
MTLTVVLGFGLVLGMQHATEPDHLAAVASLAVRERSLRHGVFHGIAWDIGHTLMLLLVAGAVGFLGWVISQPE